MLRSGRRDVEVPARVAAAARRFAHLVSAKYVFCGFLFFVNFTNKRVPELVRGSRTFMAKLHHSLHVDESIF